MSTSTRASAADLTAEKILKDPHFPEKFPFTNDDFQRLDESPDTQFYSQPRFVTHIDDMAIQALAKYYDAVFPPSGNQDVAILDLCSSWISHYPKRYKAGRISGLGLNEDELKKNVQLTDFKVQDLNVNPKLPYDDNTFDIITNTVSTDYLTKPLEIYQEMHRILKPNGLAIMSFSNRYFPTKVIALWSQTGDMDHVWIVGSYFHFSVPRGFNQLQAMDITDKTPLTQIFGGSSDPMYVVQARKQVV